MLPRLYAPGLELDHPFALPRDEAHHLRRVLRLATGDTILVFDGRGEQYEAVVVEAAKDLVVVRATVPHPAPVLPAVAISVVQAVLKGSSMDDAVRDATMMGAVEIEPLLTAHVEVKPAVASRAATVERWRRIALASVKQCRRATIPAVHEPRHIAEWLTRPSAEMRLLFAEPSARCMPRALKSLLEHQVPSHAAVLIGPEGGWSPQELEAAIAAGCTPVSLGPLTLRAESMAVAALAALGALWQD